MLTAAFAQRGLDVIQRSFRWVGWEPIGQPHVEITLGDGSRRQLQYGADGLHRLHTHGRSRWTAHPGRHMRARARPSRMAPLRGRAGWRSPRVHCGGPRRTSSTVSSPRAPTATGADCDRWLRRVRGDRGPVRARRDAASNCRIPGSVCSRKHLGKRDRGVARRNGRCARPAGIHVSRPRHRRRGLSCSRATHIASPLYPDILGARFSSIQPPPVPHGGSPWWSTVVPRHRSTSN